MTRRSSQRRGSTRSMRLLNETEMIEPLRKAISGCSDLRIAVAFWGKGASRTLGLAKATHGRILCNLESGACNPAEIRKLLKSKKLQIRTHPELHAKIYWTPQAALVGSSNASANGLVVDPDVATGWREANIYFENPEVVGHTREYFDLMWNEGARLTKSLLSQAEAKWRLRSRASKILSIGSKTIFGAIAEDPSIFDGEQIYLAIYDGWASHEAQIEQRRYKSENRLAERFADGLVVHPRTLTTYEDWRGMRSRAWLIDCSFVDPKKPKVFGLYRVWEGGKIKLATSSIQFAYKTPAIVVSGCSFGLTAEDRRIIEKNASKLFQAASGRSSDMLEIKTVAKICKIID